MTEQNENPTATTPAAARPNAADEDLTKQREARAAELKKVLGDQLAIGRIVWFTPLGGPRKPVPAIITEIQDEESGTIALTAFLPHQHMPQAWEKVGYSGAGDPKTWRWPARGGK